MPFLSSAPALEPLRHHVGHVSTLAVDTARNDRVLGIDVWYPAATGAAPITEYELIPGVRFQSASARTGPPVIPGRHPLLVWSHGRTGTRHNYSLLCEALASRGYVVVSPDHPGDGLLDWFTGANVDDATNERQRQGDVRFCIDAALGATAPFVDWITKAVDAGRVFVGGHSYGGLTALGTTTRFHEFAPDERVRATVVAQGYTRTLPTGFFTSLVRPTMMLVGLADATTPPETDADPAWNLLRGRDDEVFAASRRIDMAHAPHQGCSDFSLYAELAPRVPGLPEAVSAYLDAIAAEIPREWSESWRDGLRQHVEHIDEFLTGF